MVDEHLSEILIYLKPTLRTKAHSQPQSKIPRQTLMFKLAPDTTVIFYSAISLSNLNTPQKSRKTTVAKGIARIINGI